MFLYAGLSGRVEGPCIKTHGKLDGFLENQNPIKTGCRRVPQ